MRRSRATAGVRRTQTGGRGDRKRQTGSNGVLAHQRQIVLVDRLPTFVFSREIVDGLAEHVKWTRSAGETGSVKDMEPVDRVELERLYRDDFHPENYVSTYYSSMDQEVQFFLHNLHEFFSTVGKMKSSVKYRQVQLDSIVV